MDSFLKTILTFLIITPIAFSQEINDTLKTSNQTVITKINFTLDDLDFYLDLQSLNKSILLNEDPNTKWLWTSYAISNSNNQATSSNANLSNITLPLYQNYLEASKFNPFRYALGMVQVGAVGYLAYKHIKKYGFLKK